MKSGFSNFANSLIAPLGLKLIRKPAYESEYPIEATKKEQDIMNYVQGYTKSSQRLTMVSSDRLWAAINAVKYVVNAGVDGDIVECGVWRGGCSLAMAMMLKEMNSAKKIILFDTFAGMTTPCDKDIEAYSKTSAYGQYNQNAEAELNQWCYASIEDVKNNFEKANCTDYAKYIEGNILSTLDNNRNLPSCISLLRLDTDFYESTKKEMTVLYPLLQKFGVLLVDDYGFWEGSRKAVDEYFKVSTTASPLLWKTDHTGRGILKV